MKNLIFIILLFQAVSCQKQSNTANQTKSPTETTPNFNAEELVQVLDVVKKNKRVKGIECLTHDEQFNSDFGSVYSVYSVDKNIQIILVTSTDGYEGVGGEYCFYYHNQKLICLKAEYFLSGGQPEATKLEIYFENGRIIKSNCTETDCDRFIQIGKNLYGATDQNNFCALNYDINF